MNLELRLHPDDAVRLPRLRSIAAAARGRPRMQRRRLIWHDSPNQALAGAGLVLAEERGEWRLERLVPGRAIWSPGTPSPVLERAAALAGFEHALPAPLAPVASLDGRLATYTLDTDQGAVGLGLLRGVLRGVTDAQPACRVLLAGEEAPVRGVAVSLAEHLRLEVPHACLAAEAFALVHATPPPPRQLGPAALPDVQSVAEAFAFVVGHLTDVILHFAVAALDSRAGPEAVHQMRVAVRRLRSSFSLFRPVVGCAAVEAAEADLKSLSDRLAPARDWDVFMTETSPPILATLPDEVRLPRLLRAAERRRQACHVELRTFLQGSAFRRLGIELAWLAAARSWQAELDPAAQDVLRGAVAPFAAEVLHRRLRKLLGAADGMEALALAALHGVRLRAKRLRYAAEVFAPVWPGKPQRRFIERLSRLQQRLGELNDAMVAGALMAALDGTSRRHAYAAGLVQGFTAACAGASRGGVIRSWEKFRRQEPFWA